MTVRDKVFYIVGSIVFFVLGPCIMLVLYQINSAPFLPNAKFLPYLGSACSVVGLVLCFLANYELIRIGKGCAGVIGPLKLMTETKKLVTSGVYSLCRNPMHFGIILFYLGLSCAINSLWSLAVPLLMTIFAYIVAVCFDEKRLKRDFKEEYEAWASQVPRFIPRIRK